MNQILSTNMPNDNGRNYKKTKNIHKKIVIIVLNV